LAAVVVLVAGVGLVGALTLPARSANPPRSSSSPGYAVSYYHHATLLGTRALANGTALDIVWKNTACSNGYGSPPAAFTWSSDSTGVTSAPIIGPCGTPPGSAFPGGANDLECKVTIIPPFADCWWTYKKNSGSATAQAKIANPGGGTGANVYLFKRTALYAYLTVPGKPKQKISVPAGADTIKFAPTS
jgi:hypothetical protein